MIVANVGIGSGSDAEKAGREACLQALSGLPGEKAKLLIAFGSATFDQEKLLSGISSVSADSLLVGCSTAGEISSEGLSTDKSVVVMAIQSDTVSCWGSVGQHLMQDGRRAGEECANALQYDSHNFVSSALLFLDVMNGKGDTALEGFIARAGANFPIYGGAAADDLLFFETFQYLNKSAYSNSLVGLGLSGNFVTAGVAMHGFLPIGISRKVTRSEGTTLYELDGKPAVSIYEEYFGEEHLSNLREGLLPSMAISYPLGIFSSDKNDVFLRTPVFVDKKGAMTFTASIPEGSDVRLMISDIEEGLHTAELVAQQLLRELKGKRPRAAIIFNSVSRKRMLGLRADEEISTIQKILGRDVPIAGYYGYGQIGRHKDLLDVPMHNGSLLIWAIAE